MKKLYMITGLLSFILFSGSMAACSGGSDDSPTPDDGTENTPTGTVPDNTDSGNNNNSTPDNKDTGTSSGETTQWNLVFEDNFEGTSDIPDQSKWSLAPKGDDTWNRHMSESYGQAYQKDGYLYLFGMMSDGEYLTGGIESREKFDFTYGQVKCRARFLRQPQGNHTGIWMMPEPPADRWPMAGEIDIMEHIDGEDVVYETVHNWWADEMGHGDDPKDHAEVKVDNTDFNIYGIIWDENSISFTVNGEVKFTYDNKNLEGENGFYQYPYVKPFYLILSQSLGGKGTWEGVIDDNELPAIFQIDWIKVWQKTEN